MATPTLAKSPESHPAFDGNLIDNLVRTVEEAQKPKPPQPATPSTDEDQREQNARMLIALWEQGEKMAAQAFEIPRPKPDPLTIALNGFPDVNTYYAYQAGIDRG